MSNPLSPSAHGHCFHRDRDALVPQIVSPVKTLLRYACCVCAEAAYLGVGLGDDDQPARDPAPGAGSHVAQIADGGRCATCGQCPPAR